jgi:SAM-dependent methyltransferase
MKFLELKDISERYLELVNPTSPEKILTVGRVLGLNEGSHVIDFGSGYGEVLALWAQHFGISGIGIDLREKACKRARAKMAEGGLADRIQIVCGNAAGYAFEPHAFDVAACIGASFIWNGYRPALGKLKEAIKPNGKVAIGEPSWRTTAVPPEYSRNETVHTEYELLHIAREEGFDFEYVVRAGHDDWDHYEAGNWRGLVRWIDENPDHPERQGVIEHLHQSQDEYTRYAREYFGWAIYVLHPVHYRA